MSAVVQQSTPNTRVCSLHTNIFGFACCILLLLARCALHKGALTDGDRCSHLVLSDPDTNHCQQSLSCHVSLVWPAHTLTDRPVHMHLSARQFSRPCRTRRCSLQGLQFCRGSDEHVHYTMSANSLHGTALQYKLYLQSLLDGMTIGTAVWACWFLCVLVLYQNLAVRIMMASKLRSVTR